MRNALALMAVGLAGCSQPAVPPAGKMPAPVAPGSVYARMPPEVGAFKLTERGVVTSRPADSLFRFSDGSTTAVTVIIYDISPDVRVDPDSQKWTAHEGEKFREVQAIRRSRGQIADFTDPISDTTRLLVHGQSILEHWIAVPTRFANGNVVVETQHLYLISGKFLKVRTTVPANRWGQSGVSAFARQLAERLAGGS